MLNYFNYFTEVEEYFIRRRGKNLLVAPLDWCLIELWRDSGIPLNVVLRGIDRAFEALASRGAAPPRSLFYCHPAVLETFQEHQQAMLGTSQQEPGEDGSSQEDPEGISRRQVESALAGLLGALRSDEREAYRRASERLGALIEDLKDARQVGYERIDRELSQIGATLAEDLMRDMDSGPLRELRKEVRSETRLYRKRLDKEMMTRLQTGYLHRKILELHHLPSFSLFSFDEA